MLLQCLLGRISALTLHTPEVKHKKKEKKRQFLLGIRLKFQPTTVVAQRSHRTSKQHKRSKQQPGGKLVQFFDDVKSREEENVSLLCSDVFTDTTSALILCSQKIPSKPSVQAHSKACYGFEYDLKINLLSNRDINEVLK